MFECLLWATAAVLLRAGWVAYRRTRDPLHPLVYLAPLLGYAFVYRPALLHYSGALDPYFPDRAALVPAQGIFLGGILLFCAGVFRSRPTQLGQRPLGGAFALTPATRQIAFRLGIVLGVVAVGAFAYVVGGVGGAIEVFSKPKGGARAESGYLGEAPLLAFPAIVLLLLAWKGKALTLSRIALLLAIASPHLVVAFLGARRGPAFLVLATLFFARPLIEGRRPSLKQAGVATAVIGVAVLALFAYRPQIHVGARLDLDRATFVDTIAPTQVSAGDEYVHAAGSVLVADAHHLHSWGKRLMILLFVRPIPRQLWPTKYEDVGLAGAGDPRAAAEASAPYWLETVGFVPLAGASSGFVADLFMEFSYAGLLVCFLFGWVYGGLWLRARQQHGIWVLLYVFAVILAVYVPTQSVSAWIHRFLFMSIPTLLLWRRAIRPVLSNPRSRPRRWDAAEAVHSRGYA